MCYDCVQLTRFHYLPEKKIPIYVNTFPASEPAKPLWQILQGLVQSILTEGWDLIF
jgi:hypothetical protein